MTKDNLAASSTGWTAFKNSTGIYTKDGYEDRPYLFGKIDQGKQDRPFNAYDHILLTRP